MYNFASVSPLKSLQGSGTFANIRLRPRGIEMERWQTREGWQVKWEEE